MSSQIAILGKSLATKLTDETLIGMDAFVIGKIRRVPKRLATQATGVRTFICVNTSVSLEITGLTKAFVTHVTNICLVITANTFATSKLENTAVRLWRRVQLMWLIHRMNFFMTEQTARLSKGLVT